MFGVSFTELILIFGVALIVFGPEKLPEIARKLGKFSAELRKGTDAMRREFYNSVYTPAREIEQHVHMESRRLITLPTEPLSGERKGDAEKHAGCGTCETHAGELGAVPQHRSQSEAVPASSNTPSPSKPPGSAQ